MGDGGIPGGIGVTEGVDWFNAGRIEGSAWLVVVLAMKWDLVLHQPREWIAFFGKLGGV